MKDRGCAFLLPLAILAALAGLRHHADSLAEREAQLTRQPEVFRRHYRAGDDGRVEALDAATTPDERAVRRPHRRCRRPAGAASDSGVESPPPTPET